MGFIDWIKQRKERAELNALARKYGHDSIGTPGPAIRHYQRLVKLQGEPGGEAESIRPKTKSRRWPSWER